MQKAIATIAISVTGLLLASAAQAATGFEGAYAPSSASISTSHGGSIDASAAPSSITLYGGSDSGGVASDQLYSFSLPLSGTLFFNWSYTQNDCCGAYWDPFGYWLNGVFTQLTNDSGPDAQSGVTSLLLNAGDVFAFDLGFGSQDEPVSEYAKGNRLHVFVGKEVAPFQHGASTSTAENVECCAGAGSEHDIGVSAAFLGELHDILEE